MKPLAPLALALLLWTPSAHAIDLYSEADLGATQFLGAGHDAADLGPSFGGRLGLGFLPWLSVGAHATGSTHRVSIQGPSLGDYFQVYNLGADLRARVPVGRVGIYVDGGGGWAWISTNILDSVGLTQPTQHNGPYFTVGGGVEYATENPRYAFGFGGAFTKYLDFGTLQTVSAHFYIRYTK